MGQSMHTAAMTALQIPMVYLKQGKNLAWAAMAGAQNLELLRHYPLHDVVDPQALTRFYYHAHPLEGDADEHGHFHLFHQGVHGFHHLAALALDALGRPTRWFSTNRWVTGETWLPPTDIEPMLRQFDCQTRGRMAPVARWLTAMVALYQEELIALHHLRAKLTANLNADDLQQLAEDRGTHVLDSTPVVLQDRIQSIISPTS